MKRVLNGIFKTTKRVLKRVLSGIFVTLWHFILIAASIVFMGLIAHATYELLAYGWNLLL